MLGESPGTPLKRVAVISMVSEVKNISQCDVAIDTGEISMGIFYIGLHAILFLYNEGMGRSRNSGLSGISVLKISVLIYLKIDILIYCFKNNFKSYQLSGFYRSKMHIILSFLH